MASFPLSRGERVKKPHRCLRQRRVADSKHGAIPVRVHRPAGPVRHPPAGALDDRDQRRPVPQLQPRLRDHVDAAQRQQAIGVAVPAPRRSACRPGQPVPSGLLPGRENFRRRARQLRLRQSGTGPAPRPAMHPPELRRPPRRADPALPRDGLVDHPQDRRISVQQRHQHPKRRAAGDEGAGAIDRVQHPAHPRPGPLPPKLLAQDAVAREPLRQQAAHRLFRRPVGSGDRAGITLQLRVDAAPVERPDRRPRQVRRSLRRRDQLIQRCPAPR